MSTRKQTLARRRKRRNEDRAERNKTARMATAQAAKPIKTVRYKPMLDRYHSRGQISSGQHKSGGQFRDDWLAMGSLITDRSITSCLEWMPSGEIDPTPSQIDAKYRVDKAIKAMGKHLASVAINVCFYDFSASEWAVAFGKRPADDGISCLRLALDALSEHYKKSGIDLNVGDRRMPELQGNH